MSSPIVAAMIRQLIEGGIAPHRDDGVALINHAVSPRPTSGSSSRPMT
ncbi:MAG: hypothetical protein GY698_08720 [Actinomycetia bacterium]|nr:hypothetical protein [Actinomycetes bacterium]